MVTVLPFRVSSLVAGAASVGVGGSRVGGFASLGAGVGLVSVVAAAGSAVFVSCGAGVPALVRAAFPAASVFSASSFQGLGRGAFAARARALVVALSAAPSPLWVCFPVSACPAAAATVGPRGLGRSWVSCGSGSWSECRLAAGLGVPVLVFLPAGVVPPGAWGSWLSVGWSAGGQWYWLPAGGGVGLFGLG